MILLDTMKKKNLTDITEQLGNNPYAISIV